MPLQLYDATLADGAAIANVYVSAFIDDPFHMTLYPSVSFERQVSGVLSRWPRNYANSSARYKTVVDTTTGETVSYSKWSFGFTDAAKELPSREGLFPFTPDPNIGNH
jgi:hypothetical protein